MMPSPQFKTSVQLAQERRRGLRGAKKEGAPGMLVLAVVTCVFSVAAFGCTDRRRATAQKEDAATESAKANAHAPKPPDLTPGAKFQPPSDVATANCEIGNLALNSRYPDACVSGQFIIHNPRAYGLSDEYFRKIWIKNKNDAIALDCRGRWNSCTLFFVVKDRFY